MGLINNDTMVSSNSATTIINDRDLPQTITDSGWDFPYVRYIEYAWGDFISDGLAYDKDNELTMIDWIREQYPSVIEITLVDSFTEDGIHEGFQLAITWGNELERLSAMMKYN